MIIKNCVVTCGSVDCDVVYDIQSNDTIKITSGSYTTQKSSDDLILNIGNGNINLKDARNTRVIVQNANGYFDTLNKYGVANIGKLSDHQSLIGSSYNDKVYNAGKNVIVSLGAGNDYFMNDEVESITTITAGTGDDTILNYNTNGSIIKYT